MAGADMAATKKAQHAHACRASRLDTRGAVLDHKAGLRHLAQGSGSVQIGIRGRLRPAYVFGCIEVGADEPKQARALDD